MLKLSDFMKTLLPGSKLSFARWIMSIIKMLQISTLRILWQNDFIEGFICKEPVDRLPCPGSFLLRFSERKSAIGVVLKIDDGTLEPWTPYDDACLQKNNLANLLDHFDNLELLVKANGDVVNRVQALEPYMDCVPVNDGYTKRGGYNRNGTTCSEGTSSQGMETVIDGVAPEDGVHCDLNEILIGCNSLLNEYELMETN